MYLPTTLDVDGWLIAVRAIAYDDPIRTMLLVLVIGFLLWAIFVERSLRSEHKQHLRKEQELLALKEKELLRGSKMRKKDRHIWARRHMADIVTSALEDAQDRGELTDAEVSWGYRKIAEQWKIPDLKKRKLMGIAEVVKPCKNKCTPEHLNKVKSGIIQRMGFRVRALLNKPVAIPGPPPAEAQTRILKLPKMEKGLFCVTLTPRKRI